MENKKQEVIPLFTRWGKSFIEWCNKPMRFRSGSGSLVIPEAAKNKIVEGQMMMMGWKTKEEIKKLLEETDIFDNKKSMIIIPTNEIQKTKKYKKVTKK